MLPYVTGTFIDSTYLRVSYAGVYVKKLLESQLSLAPAYHSSISTATDVISFGNANANVRITGTLFTGSVTTVGSVSVGNT